MISLYDAQITDILPEYLKSSDEVKALSYAVSCAMKRAIDHSRNISVYAVIDDLPENILDLLALELNTQYYEDSFSVHLKRNLIKNTLKWYQHTGTPAAVEETVTSIFGNGTIQEWFEYGGNPYHFKINTSAMNTTDDMIERVTKAISVVQNVRSYLEEVVVEVMQQSCLFWGSVPKCIMDCTSIGMDMSTDLGIDASDSYYIASKEGTTWLFMVQGGKLMVQEYAEPIPANFPYILDSGTGKVYELSVSEHKTLLLSETVLSEKKESKKSVFFVDAMDERIYSLSITNGKLYLI